MSASWEKLAGSLHSVPFGSNLRLIAEAYSTKEIAIRLGLSDRTIETHRTHLFRKLGCRSVVELVRYAIRHGEVEL